MGSVLLGLVMSRVVPLTSILLLLGYCSLLLVTAATPVGATQDEVNTAAPTSSETSVRFNSHAGLPLALQFAGVPSSINDDDDQDVVIRKSRSPKNMGRGARGGRGHPYCRGPNCRYNRRRNPYLPSYLLTIQEKNSPSNQGSRRRNRNNGGSQVVYIPKRSESETISVTRPTARPIMYIANPKPISHPKKSKGRRIA